MALAIKGSQPRRQLRWHETAVFWATIAALALVLRGALYGFLLSPTLRTMLSLDAAAPFGPPEPSSIAIEDPLLLGGALLAGLMALRYRVGRRNG